MWPRATDQILGLAPANAAARSVLRPCGDGGRLSCGRISVALDPGGHVPGRVGIAVERYPQAARPTGTIVALAGGPGQSAIGVLPLFRAGRLTIDLATKRYGTVVLGSDGSLRGTLGGVSVSLTPAQRTAVDNAGGLGFIATL